MNRVMMSLSRLPALVPVMLLILSGCGGGSSSVAICFGTAEFCQAFRESVKEDASDDDDASPSSEQVSAETERAALALAVGLATPVEIGAAFAEQRMPGFAAEQPQLVGLWLMHAVMVRLSDPDDHVAATRFLDQQRVWLPSAPASTASQSTLLDRGLLAFADYAAERDPGAAAAAREVAGGKADTVALAYNIDDALLEAAIEWLNTAAHHDPSQKDLAAAVVVLCRLAAPADAISRELQDRGACASAARWFAAAL